MRKFIEHLNNAINQIGLTDFVKDTSRQQQKTNYFQVHVEHLPYSEP